MKTSTKVYYVLMTIFAGAVWVGWLIDLARSGQLKELLLPVGGILLFVGVALGLVFFYFYRRGGASDPSDPNQVGCVMLIALIVVALVALVVVFIMFALGIISGD